MMGLFPLAAIAAVPVINNVVIVNVGVINVGTTATAEILVQSDSATFTLDASSDIGSYGLLLGTFAKDTDERYTVDFVVDEGENDYAAGTPIPVDITLWDGVDSGTGPASITYGSDIDAHSPAKPAPPDLHDASDKGYSNTDNETNENLPTFIGVNGAVEGNSTVRLYRGGSTLLGTTPANADGAWSIASALIPDGTHSITVTATDAAGNVSVASDPLPNVVIDIQDPDDPGNRAPADGAWVNATPPSPLFTWTAPADNGDSGIRNYRVQIWGPATRNYYTENLFYDPVLGSDGTYTWRLYAIDEAGNNGDAGASTWTVKIDSKIPTPVVDLADSSDTGSDNSDDLTNDTTPTFRVSFDSADASLGDVVELLLDGGSLASAVTKALDAADIAAEYVDLTVTDGDLGIDGTKTMTAAISDAAGNQATSAALYIELDTTAPTVTAGNISISGATGTAGAYKFGDTVTASWDDSGTGDNNGDIATVSVNFGEFAAGVPVDATDPDTDDIWTTAAQGLDPMDLTDRNVFVTVTDDAGNVTGPVEDDANAVVDTIVPTIDSVTSTTADGYYKLNGSINVTVSFSEPVTCSGDFFSVTLSTSDVVQWGSFALSGVIDTTYQVGAGDNSCMLDATNVDLSAGETLRDDAGNDTGVTLPDTTIADGSNITVDTTIPAIGAISIWTDDDRLDENCEETVSYSVTITDNCCIDIDASPVTVTPAATNASVSGLTMTLTPDTGKVTSVLVSGMFVVSVTDACSSVPSVQIDVVDCAGNTATRTDSGPTLTDPIAPTFQSFTVTPDDGFVDGNCKELVDFQVDVHDNCSIDIDDLAAIVVTTSATNASTSGLTWSADKVGLQTDFTVTGSFTVEGLLGCPAVPTVEVHATDLCGNLASTSEDGAGIWDDIIPVINDLKFNTNDTYAFEKTVPYLVDECGLVVVYFSANVTDNCCIAPGNVNVSVTLPMEANEGFAILEDIVVNPVPNGQDRVDITGHAVVRCLESCPPNVCMSRMQVDVAATDCCGNVADPDATGLGEGLVNDDILPIPRDDPRQDMVLDESAVVDPLVEVRLDEFGTYRLILRENTPVRIDVMGNDADNLSHNAAHPFLPCVQCGSCGGQTRCCAVMYIHEIVEPPSYGTATIEDDTGNCHGGTVIRYAPDHGRLGPDYFTYRTRDAFGNVSSVIATVYLQTVEETVMEDVAIIACSGEPTEFDVVAADLWVDRDPAVITFGFEIVDGPSHGVVVGDPTQITLSPPSLGPDPNTGELVPTLDFTEAARIRLTYTSTVGHIGRDSMMIRIDDPFGAFAIARVDIRVIECAPGAGAVPTIEVGQDVVLPIIVPESFAVVAETSPGAVLLMSTEDGLIYPGALSILWSEEMHRYVLFLHTGTMPLGRYSLTIPLGNGDHVELIIEVGETE